MKLKKILALCFAVILVLSNLAGCKSTENSKVLRICNCEDYIDEDILGEFEELYDCKIEYSTFGTLENLYNDIIITPDRYDLICPSEYMIIKMAKEGLLRTIEFDPEGNYRKYVSPYIADIFDNIQCDGEYSLTDYAGCYMWGTLGLVYNPESIEFEDMEFWASLWDSKYKNQATIKDSIRDTYFMGNAYANKQTLLELAEKYADDNDIDYYQEQLSLIFNNTSVENVDNVETALKTLKSNIYGLEVDSGKNDIASGKININVAWSGDAVYAMDEAETQGVELYYSVPKEGSNVWFDGWCVPKNAKNVDLAIAFIDFLSDPEIVVRNMDYIGYTSGIGGGEDPENNAIFDNAIDWYGVCTLSEISEEEYLELDSEEQEEIVVTDDDKYYEYVYAEDLVTGNDDDGYVANLYVLDEESNLVVQEETEVYKVDLSYFFGGDSGDYVIYTDTLDRQFSAQYPTEEIISRCVVMNYFDDEANSRVNLMWERMKGFALPTWAIILIFIFIMLIIASVIIFKNKDKIFKIDYTKMKETTKKHKYKVVKIEKL